MVEFKVVIRLGVDYLGYAWMQSKPGQPGILANPMNYANITAHLLYI
jgi:hypothetical protein